MLARSRAAATGGLWRVRCRRRPRCAAAVAAGDRSDPSVGTTRPDLAVVFVHPRIAENTGTTARTCAAARVGLHLVEPLGFETTSPRLKRAGLDYWDAVHVSTHASFAAFLAAAAAAGPARFVAFSTRGNTHDATPGLYTPPAGGTTYLLFGAETTGLPEAAHEAAAAAGAVVRLPASRAHVRSLNVAVTAGVGVYEALRQIDGCDGPLE